MVYRTESEDMVDIAKRLFGTRELDNTETVGAASDFPELIRFESSTGSEKERTPVCPDCGEELQIATDSPDAWELDCGCSDTPVFTISREE